MPATSELQNFKKKIHTEVVLVYSENTRAAVLENAQAWQFCTLENTDFICIYTDLSFFCLCHSTVQGLYLRCQA